MDIFKVNNTRSWANIANNNSKEKRKARHATRRAKGEASRTPSPVKRYVAPKPAPAPTSGNTRGTGDKMMIYTKKPVILANGRQVRGHWTRAVDPEGDYGGPYANMRNLLENPRYRADMKEFEQDREYHQKYVRNMQARLAGPPGFNRMEARRALRAMGVTRKRSGSRSKSHK